MMWAYIREPFNLYHTIWIILLAYITRFLLFGVKAVSNAITQIHEELERAAVVSGANWFVVLESAVPLASRALLLADYIVVSMMRELSASIMLFSSNNEVIGTILIQLYDEGLFSHVCILSLIIVILSLGSVALVRWITTKGCGRTYLMQEVRVEKLVKRFNYGISFKVPRGTLSLLGPSGCGKTTTLNMIAGFEDPDGGDVFVGDKLISSAQKNILLPAHERNLGMVFQSYGLWPHLRVSENVSFGLEMRRKAKAEVGPAVERALELVRLGGMGERYPSQLSGGQQQRVAFARPLCMSPMYYSLMNHYRT